MSYDFENGVFRLVSENGYTTTIVPSQTSDTTLTAPSTDGEYVTDSSSATLVNKDLTSTTNEISANMLRVDGKNIAVKGGMKEGYVLTNDGESLVFAEVKAAGGINYASEWNSGKYNESDMVTYEGNLYICTAATENKPGDKGWDRIAGVGIGANTQLPIYNNGQLSYSGNLSFDGNLNITGKSIILNNGKNYNTITGTDSGINFELDGKSVFTFNDTYLQIPTSSTTILKPVNGMMRFNTDINAMETYSNGTWILQGGVINKDSKSLIVTSTSDVNILNYQLPGGILKTNGVLRIKSSGHWQNTSGSNGTFIMSIYFGDALVWQDKTKNLKGGTHCGWNIELLMCANNSEMNQTISGEIKIGGTGYSYAGEGDLGNDEIQGVAVIYGSCSENSNNTQAIRIMINQSRTGLIFTKLYHTIELI